MTRRIMSPSARLVIITASVWFLSVAFLIWPAPIANSAMRFILIIVAIAVTAATFRRSERRCLLSPPYLLGILVLIFYALCPALYLRFSPQLPTFFSGGGAEGQAWTEAFVGSRGELLVLQFTAMCFVVASLVLRYTPASGPLPSPNATLRTLGMIWAPAVVMTIAFLYLLIGQSSAVSGMFVSGIGAQVKAAMAPVMSLCLAVIGCAAGSLPSRRVIGAIGIATAALTITILSSGFAYISVSMAVSALLLFATMRRTSGAELARIAMIVAGVVIASIILSALIRPRLPGYTHKTLAYIEAKLVSKLAFRQGVSGNCLNRIVNRYAGTERAGPFYFLYAVVPRAIWPEKPILSRGNEYARKYCGEGNVDPRHSESITLIGEPILSAGTKGLIIAEMFLAALLGGAAMVGLSGGLGRLILLTAMLPWLVTFEQHFAQYVGNVAKMFLIMLIVLALVSWAVRLADLRDAGKPA
jgi:hypothetical protein